MENLPQEIITDILSRLTVKSLLRFRCVCKTWHTLISNSSFIETHLYRSVENSVTSTFIFTNDFTNLYSIDYDVCNGEEEITKLDISFLGGKFSGFIIVGSCNGLLCLSDWKYTTLLLWNPSTREYKKIPSCPVKVHDSYMFSYLALGYHPMTKKYKIIGIRKFDSIKPAEVMVYTLGCGSWRSLGNIPWFIDNLYPATFVRGTLYWKAVRIEGYHTVIVSFDVGTEEFQEIQWPCNMRNHGSGCYLRPWKGGLALFHPLLGRSVEVWTMKDHGVKKEPWIKKFAFENPENIDVGIDVSRFRFLKNGEILLRQVFTGKFIVYDPEKDKATHLRAPSNLTAPSNPHIHSLLGIYVSSLVSPSAEDEDGIEEQ